MSKRAKSLTMILSLALLVSLTMACSLGGAGAPTEESRVTETPVSGQPPGETPEPTSPLEEWPFELEEGALDNLDSYVYILHFEGLSAQQGTAEETSLDIQGQRQIRPTKAEQVSFSSTNGDSQTTEFIYIEEENALWTRDPEGDWEELPVMDASMVDTMFQAFSLGFWWNTLFTGDPADVQYVGQEMMNGVQTNHYRTGEVTSWGFAVGCAFGSVNDDIWVAVDGAFPVKRQFDASGECEGVRGEVHFLMEVSNINQPVSITPPM